MNWDQVEGKWKQLRGSAKQKWAKLTDNDLDYIAGSRDRFIGKIQERYGIAKEEAQMQSDQWLSGMAETGTGAGTRPMVPERTETHRSGSST